LHKYLPVSLGVKNIQQKQKKIMIIGFRNPNQINRPTIIIILITLQLAACLPTNQPSPLPVTPSKSNSTRISPTQKPVNTLISSAISFGDTITPTIKRPNPTPTLTFISAINPKECIPITYPKEVGIVDWVTDGDTIVVNINGSLQSVRYIGINSPEELFITERFGPTSKRRNIELVEGQLVELFRDQNDKDEYGQLLRYVIVNDVFVNHQLIVEGLALTQASQNNLSCVEHFNKAEISARNAGIGIWDASITAFYENLTPTVTNTKQTLSFTPTPSNTPSTPTPYSNKTPTNSNSKTPTNTQSATATKSSFTINPTFQTPEPEETDTAVPSKTHTPSPSPTLHPGSSSIEIIDIYYSGDPTTAEKDEYLEFQNFSNQPIDISNWILYADSLGIDFIFPEFIISPGQVCRIYTNEYHSEFCGFSFESDIPVWENEEGDCGYLFNLELEEISEFCY
jgi:endonuclease YncB( thermonuclease family)